uniref:Uncharacterized protein n=1 Tax=Bionectria ochroleuca TaxID=29856 RepID=A0A0B7JQL6_BIOOC
MQLRGATGGRLSLPEPRTKQYDWLSGRFDHRDVVILSRGLFGCSNISLGFRVYKGPTSSAGLLRSTP